MQEKNCRNITETVFRKAAARTNVSPQNVYKSFTSSVPQLFSFLARITTNIEDLLPENEKSINDEILPNLLKNPAYYGNYRNIFSLPKKEVGLNILKPEDRI